MKKKLIPILIVAVVVVAGALYFLVLRPDDGEKPVVYTEYSPGDFFVVNVADTNNLFKVAPVLVLDTDKLSEQLTAGNVRIRDTIYTVLRSLHKETILDVTKTDDIRKQIADAVNKRMEITNVVDVYFTEFVVQ
jgi:flagellar basal body-associated protein FliL